MGLEIPEEFWPITPIQTIPKPRTTKSNHNNNKENINNNNNKENVNEENVKESVNEENVNVPLSSKNARVVNQDEEEEECVTPKSEAQLLKVPLVCPPAPRKPPPVPRKRKLSPQAYFEIPISDLEYLFMEVITVPTKKIKAAG